MILFYDIFGNLKLIAEMSRIYKQVRKLLLIISHHRRASPKCHLSMSENLGRTQTSQSHYLITSKSASTPNIYHAILVLNSSWCSGLNQTYIRASVSGQARPDSAFETAASPRFFKVNLKRLAVAGVAALISVKTPPCYFKPKRKCSLFS